MKKIVIFDMDGTLIDSKKDITISVNYVRMKNHDLPPLSEEYVVKAINKKHRNLAKLFYETEIYEEKDRELFEQHYKEQCIQNPYLYDGIKEVLESLHVNGVLMGVATNAPTPFAKEMLTHLGIEHYFVKIVGADKVKQPKPDPQMIHIILEACSFEQGDKAWMVGDNPKDIEVAHNAGIEAIYATWGFQSDFDYEIKIKDPKEILKIVL
ncbi:MAG: HAD-IA family hydrolase [Epsilonproteobacteria bacterium]|nr:HAD-IA family hydrolase [Campylobacterota bacterium]